MTIQTPEPPAKSQTFTRHGLTISRAAGGKTKRGAVAKFQTRIRFRGTVHKLTLAETADASFDMAVRARRAIHEGRYDEIRNTIALRVPAAGSALGQLLPLYRQFVGHDRPQPATLEQNIHALTAILRETLGPQLDPNTLPLTKLTPDLLWKWKEQRRAAAGLAPDDHRAQQLLRSANSRLRQARSLFSDNDDLRSYYRHHHIILPDTLTAFCAEPGFPNVDKDEYHAPSDAIMARTLEHLLACPRPETDHPGPMLPGPAAPLDRNMYVALWLAIGFGLRKSEIAEARAGWFTPVGAAIYCRGDVLAKNRKFPEVRCQLQAWPRLRPQLHHLDPAAHVLTGTATERHEDTFRRISSWMTRLGWQTQHHIHEFRAWAGCQIAMAPGGRGLLDAQVFLRHASFNTTEKYYGHHLKIRLAEVQMTLPIAPAPFVPHLLALA